MPVLVSLWRFVRACGKRWYLLVFGLLLNGIAAYQLVGPPDKKLGDAGPVVHVSLSLFVVIGTLALLVAAFWAYHDLRMATLRPGFRVGGTAIPVKQVTVTSARQYVFGLVRFEQSRTETDFQADGPSDTDGVE